MKPHDRDDNSTLRAFSAAVVGDRDHRQGIACSGRASQWPPRQANSFALVHPLAHWQFFNIEPNIYLILPASACSLKMWRKLFRFNPF
jgi:hypothetical protein